MDGLSAEEHVDRAGAAIGRRRVGIGKYRRVRREVRAHAAFQDRRPARRMHAAAVHDADAPVPLAVAAIDEPFHARVRLRGRPAVQIEPARRRVAASLQLPNLAPINAWRREIDRTGIRRRLRAHAPGTVATPAG